MGLSSIKNKPNTFAMGKVFQKINQPKLICTFITHFIFNTVLLFIKKIIIIIYSKNHIRAGLFYFF